MRKLIAAALIGVTLTMPQASAYAASVEQAKTFVNDLGTQALSVIKDTKTNKPKKTKALEKLFSESVDIKWVGRFVLGRFWRTATPEQQKKYAAAYEDFLVTHYASRFSDYSGGDFKVTDAAQDDDGNFLVNMKIMSPENQEVLVDYRVREADGGKLKIYDVVVEGVSMIATQRSEFASVIGNKGLDYLIEQLENKTLAAPDEKKIADEKKS